MSDIKAIEFIAKDKKRYSICECVKKIHNLDENLSWKFTAHVQGVYKHDGICGYIITDEEYKSINIDFFTNQINRNNPSDNSGHYFFVYNSDYSRIIAILRLGYSLGVIHNHICEFEITVSDDCRQIGIGKKLLNHAIETAKKDGKELIYLSALSDNQIALDFYQKQGFSEYGKLEKAYKKQGVYLDQILMSKSLI